jgi:hypothetical protein
VEELDAYIEYKDFGYSEDHPGICFGFSVKENADNDYELELFFNDFYIVADYQSIPS